jgi:hypothetical protein
VDGLGRLLIVLGGTLLAVGVLVQALGGKLGWLGRLPGDLRFGNTVYIPLTSCILVSLVVTLVLNLIVRLFRH